MHALNMLSYISQRQPIISIKSRDIHMLAFNVRNPPKYGRYAEGRVGYGKELYARAFSWFAKSLARTRQNSLGKTWALLVFRFPSKIMWGKPVDEQMPCFPPHFLESWAHS